MFNKLSLLITVTALSLGITGVARASVLRLSGSLFYTTGVPGQNVNRIAFNYDGATFKLGTRGNIASIPGPGADGIAKNPNNGNILVGGQGNAVYEINPVSGKYHTVTAAGKNALHLMLEPGGKQLLSGGIPGDLVRYDLIPNLRPGVQIPLAGSDTLLDSVAFDPLTGKAYYTSGGPGGLGNLGLITFNNGTAKTQRLIQNVRGIHGIVYDAFTQNFILMGGHYLLQYSPRTNTFVSRLDLPRDLYFFDLGTVTGKGHLFAANLFGGMVFIDYSRTKLINSSGNFFASPSISTPVDDITIERIQYLSNLQLAKTTSIPESGNLVGLLLLGAIGSWRKLLEGFFSERQ